MPESEVTPNKRRDRPDDADSTAEPSEVAGARKRRAFLQTMGQQLREFGAEGTSPQDHSRATFGTSPGNLRPTSRSANQMANHASSATIDTPESDAAPGQDNQLPAGTAKSASKWLWRANEVHQPTTTESVIAPPLDDLLDWSQSYFDHWHPAFPFLHAPSLIDYMRRVTQIGLQLPAPSPSDAFQHVILRSIMSISVADRRQMDSSCKPIPSALMFHSYNDAISSIQLVLTEESSILSLQALVSVQLFLITMHRYNAASRLEGLAVRMAFQLGLHRCPQRLASAPDKEAELRKRLFWSIYCIDRYTSIRLGTPLGVRSDEMDVCFPHDEHHTSNGKDENECDDRLCLLEFLARHASIRGAIMETRNKSALRKDYNEADAVMEVDAEHTKWWNTVDEYLSTARGTRNITKAHQVTLLVLRFESVLALHRSVLATSKKNSAYNAALQRCISASRSVINTLHKAIQGFGAFDGSPGQRGYESTPLVWPSFTWAVWMSVFIVVFAANEGQVARDTAIRLSDKSIQILHHLGLRGTNWPEACIVAVQNLTARLREGSTRSSTAVPAASSGSKENTSASTSAAVSQHQQRITHEQGNHRGLEHWRSAQTSYGGASTMPSGIFRNTNVPTPFTTQNVSALRGDDIYTTPNLYMNPGGSYATNPVSTYLGSAGNFLGIAQQSSDNPIPTDEIMHLFDGEDMGFWFGDNVGQGGGYTFQDTDYH